MQSTLESFFKTNKKRAANELLSTTATPNDENGANVESSKMPLKRARTNSDHDREKEESIEIVFNTLPDVSEANLAMLDALTEPSWREFVYREARKPYFKSLLKFLDAKRIQLKPNGYFPPDHLVLNAFQQCALHNVRVVVLGQDPYIRRGQAMGMSFSVPRGVTPPQSLKNIYKELSSDIDGFAAPQHGDLTAWANQGVLLLNAVLTVDPGKSNSHAKRGWETFTDAAIQLVNERRSGVVFLLWGSWAQKKATLIDKKRHHILKAVHPSPLSASRGWFGSKHFSKTNQLLGADNQIDWQLPL